MSDSPAVNSARSTVGFESRATRMRDKNSWEQTPSTDRSYEEYEMLLNFSPEDIRGKTILDLGSGTTEQLNVGSQRQKIDAKVFSLNPLLGPNTEKGKTLRQLSTKEKTSAGLAEKLPFKEKTFDLIVSLYSIPLWIPFRGSRHRYQQIFSEIDRVLKSGGEARFFPVGLERPGDSEPESFHKLLSRLKRNGYRIEWRELKMNEEQMRKYGRDRGWLLIIKKP